MNSTQATQIERWHTRLQRLERHIPCSVVSSLGYRGGSRWIAFYELHGVFCIQDRFRVKQGHYAVWKLFQTELEGVPLDVPLMPIEDTISAEQMSAYLFDRVSRTLYRGRLEVIHYYLKCPTALQLLQRMNQKNQDLTRAYLEGFTRGGFLMSSLGLGFILLNLAIPITTDFLMPRLCSMSPVCLTQVKQAQPHR